MTTVNVRLSPLDVLFFRDGRPFDAGAGMPGSGTLPNPQTVAGAVRTYLMRRAQIDFGRFAQLFREEGGDFSAAAARLDPGQGWLAGLRIAGPWLDRGDGPLVAAPANLTGQGKDATTPSALLAPSDELLAGWRPEAPGLRPLLPVGLDGAGDLTPALDGYLEPSGLKAYAAGRVPKPGDLVEPGNLYVWEDRTGLAINQETAAAEEHFLYSARYLRLRPGVSFRVTLTLPDEVDAERLLPEGDLLTWGGNRRVVRMEIDHKSQALWPGGGCTSSGEAAGGRVRWASLLLSPALFDPTHTVSLSGRPESAAWIPPSPKGCCLVGVAVSGGQAVSGWDLARHQPKPLRWAVPAGSVFFWEGGPPPGADPFALAGNEADAACGWGQALPVSWPAVSVAERA